MAGGGLVTFACDGTITLASTVTNSMDTVLDGSGRSVTISGGGAVQVFCVNTNVSFHVAHLTIADGLALQGGGILNMGGRISLEEVKLVNNAASCQAEGQAAGGALFNLEGITRATNCMFFGNRVSQQVASSSNPSRTRGGALCNEHGEVYLQGCAFYSNVVAGAPGPFNIRAMLHDGSGGAVANSGTLEGRACSFVWNSSLGGAGGSYGDKGGDGNGGAICNFGILLLTDSSVVSNSACGGRGGTGAGGSGPYPSPGGPGGIGGSGNGGGLFNAGSATVARCTFTGNIGRGGAGGTGGVGGSYFGPPDQAFPGGQGGVGGRGGSACGAICDINALSVLTNCTVSFNSAIGGPGGPGGAGGYGKPNGSAGHTGPEGEAFGSLLSIGGILMNTSLLGNAPGGNCSGTFTDGGGNTSSDSSCEFTNCTPLKADPVAFRPFYLTHNFTGQETYYADAHPFAALTASQDGTVYGVSIGDDWPGAGSVFEFNTNGTDGSFAIVRGFSGSPSWGPGGPVALSGNMLYGTTLEGGTNNSGMVYRMNADGAGYAVLHSFSRTGDGYMPHAGPVLSGSTLYGTTEFGGAANKGTIFRIEANGMGYGILKNFEGGANGAEPHGELVVSGQTLYGTTSGDGSGSVIFKINTDGTGYTVLKHFNAAASAARPEAGLAISGSTLFGTTPSKGYYGLAGCGSVFKVNTDGSSFTVLKQFPDTDAPGRHAGVIVSGGRVYGTTSGDGGLTSQGTVFMMNSDGSGYTVLRKFKGVDGANPDTSLVLLGNTLYGTTKDGGFYDAGAAFSLALLPAAITAVPQSRTVEVGGMAEFVFEVTGFPMPSCQWFSNATNPLAGMTSPTLRLGPVQFAQSGEYTLVVTNAFGATTSAPVKLSVIARVERSLAPGIQLDGKTGSVLNLEYTEALGEGAIWLWLDSVTLVSPPQYYFDAASTPQPNGFIERGKRDRRASSRALGCG